MAENKITSFSRVLVIGGSAGSIDVLLKVLPGLKHHLKFPIVVVLHRKSSSESSLSDLFSSKTTLPISEIEDKQKMEPGHIYIAPADYHVLFEKNFLLSLDYSEKVNYSRPSIDVTFESAAEIYKDKTICLLLSGANSDGSAGVKAIKDNGGIVLVQDPDTADSPYMPAQAIATLPPDVILKPEAMSDFINLIY